MEKEQVKRVVIDVFPTGICGCGQRQSENTELFRLLNDVLKDFKGKVDLNIMDYGTQINESFSRLNQILENSGKKSLVALGLGAQLFRSLIPLIAINGKIAFATSVPSKDDLYAKIKEVMVS